MIRYRFKTHSVSDPRPLIDMALIKAPWWCTGFSCTTNETPWLCARFSCTTNEYATIVCYLPEDEPLYKYWDDAFDVEAGYVGEIIYSDRFPKPEWCE